MYQFSSVSQNCNGDIFAFAIVFANRKTEGYNGGNDQSWRQTNRNAILINFVGRRFYDSCVPRGETFTRVTACALHAVEGKRQDFSSTVVCGEFYKIREKL